MASPMAISTFSLLLLLVAPSLGDVTVVNQWRQMDFDFPTPQAREQAIAQGNYVPENSIPIDVQPSNAGGSCRIFVTTPRFQTGVPYSLASVQQDGQNAGRLQAYPNYDWHSSHGSNCDGITSAFRVALTDCGQMWVIDSGMIGNTQHCPPQLLLFDLATDQLVHRYRFNDPNVSPPLYIPMASLLITPIVVVRDPGVCKRTMVYTADVSYHGLVVYDYEKNTAWRVENKYMYPDPDWGTHYLAGENFTLMDGIFGLTTDGLDLYFHPLASNNEFSVPLSTLDNAANWANAVDGHTNEFQKVGVRKSECAAEAMDSAYNLYCVTLNPVELIYWNVRSVKGKNAKRIAINPMLLEFVSGMKVVKDAQGREELWMISNRFQKLAAGTMSSDEINYRITKLTLDNGPASNEIKFPGNRHNGLVFTPPRKRPY